jgi:alpha-amylase
MKKIIVTLSILALLNVSCKTTQTKNTASTIKNNTKITNNYDAGQLENAIIYEANIRQYSPEGTFKAFTQDIPKIKELGVKIIWLMPIHEVGMKNRKAFGDKSIDQVPAEDKDKYYGSHYSVKDYRSVTPNYGTKEDFDNLVKTAHKNDMLVILDWVANHTAWDHAWVTEHNDYYTRDKNGKMIAPFDWTDVAELDFNNPNLRTAMIEDMKYWITNHNIDGFRCDVAMEVPRDFWDRASSELNTVKPIFMLMEAEQPDLMENAFDMQYGWEVHHIFNKICKEENTVLEFDKYMVAYKDKYQTDDISMVFTSNHDENSWNGTEYERMKDAVETFAALTFMMPGMPLIYNGQEYDLKKRLKFFEKDQFEKIEGRMMPVYKKLGNLKNTRKALHGGKNPAAYNRLKTNNDKKILLFERTKEEDTLTFVANLSRETQSFTVAKTLKGKDLMNGNIINIEKDVPFTLKPWQYIILDK